MLFFNSHFNYYPLSWVSHSRKLNNEIIRLHERSLRIMYNDNSSTFERLLTKDNSISMHDRNLQDLETEMLKVYKEQEPDTLQDVFSLNSEPVYNLRNKFYFCYVQRPFSEPCKISRMNCLVASSKYAFQSMGALQNCFLEKCISDLLSLKYT